METPSMEIVAEDEGEEDVTIDGEGDEDHVELLLEADEEEEEEELEYPDDEEELITAEEDIAEEIEDQEEDEVSVKDEEQEIETVEEEEPRPHPRRKPSQQTDNNDDQDVDLDADHDNDLDYFDYDDDLLDDTDYDRDNALGDEQLDRGEEEEDEGDLVDEEEDSEGESEEEGDDEEEEDEDEEDEDLGTTPIEEPLDEATLELRARELSIDTFDKEEYILVYLELMRRVRVLAKHNLYIGDYLTRLCLRKKLIKEAAGGDNNYGRSTGKARSKSHHHHRHTHHHHHHHHHHRDGEVNLMLTKKARTPYELFRDTRPPPDLKRGPDRGMLKRARQLERPHPRAPSFLRKVELKVVNIHGALFQRVLRSKTRNWKEDVEVGVDGEEVIRVVRKGREITMGHPDVPVASRRVLLPLVVKGRDQQKQIKPKRKPRVPISSRKLQKFDPHYQFGPPRATLRGGGVGRGTSSRRSVAGQGRLATSSASHILAKVDKKPSVLCNGQVKATKRFARFRKPRWFDDSTMPGGRVPRRVSARSLLASQQQGSASWEALLNLENKRSKKAREAAKPSQPPLPPAQQAAEDWAQVTARLFTLLERKSEAERAHQMSLKLKLTTWREMERRNGEALAELFQGFRDFVLTQPNFSAGEMRGFRRDVGGFGDQLHTAHVSLMIQLMRHYRAKLNLALLQRVLKGKTNQGLARLGYSIADYEPRLGENRQLYQTLQRKEREVEEQGDKLGGRMKSAERGRRLLLRKSAAEAERAKGMKALEDEVGRGAVAARSAMWRYTNLLNKNKFFLLGANVVEKTHLLQDFTTRKRAMQHFELEVHKKDLARDVYQRERELTAIQVRSKNVGRDLQAFRREKTAAKRAQALSQHLEWVDGNLEKAAQKATARCVLKPSG